LFDNAFILYVVTAYPYLFEVECRIQNKTFFNYWFWINFKHTNSLIKFLFFLVPAISWSYWAPWSDKLDWTCQHLLPWVASFDLIEIICSLLVRSVFEYSLCNRETCDEMSDKIAWKGEDYFQQMDTFILDLKCGWWNAAHCWVFLACNRYLSPPVMMGRCIYFFRMFIMYSFLNVYGNLLRRTDFQSLFP